MVSIGHEGISRRRRTIPAYHCDSTGTERKKMLSTVRMMDLCMMKGRSRNRAQSETLELEGEAIRELSPP